MCKTVSAGIAWGVGVGAGGNYSVRVCYCTFILFVCISQIKLTANVHPSKVTVGPVRPGSRVCNCFRPPHPYIYCTVLFRFLVLSVVILSAPSKDLHT